MRSCVLFHVVFLIKFGAYAYDRSYTLMADAGSTGTRMYMFHFEDTKLDIRDLGKGAALSSFQDKPDEAQLAVSKQIKDASALIPALEHSKVPVMIFATAGMRLVEPSKASAVYNTLKSNLLGPAYPFDRNSFQAKTIAGREEGVYAFLAANYLSDRISADLEVRNDELMGVMDLGGSSTQIAIPPSSKNGNMLLHSLGEKDMYVQSFLSLGMERMRQLTYATLVQESTPIAHAVAKVPNPCAFTGYAEPGERWYGTGDAQSCEHLISKILKHETHSCRANRRKSGTPCLPLHMVNSVKPLAREGNPRFFMISGYVFVVDFARWWMEQPGIVPPMLADLSSDQKELLIALTNSGTFKTPTIAELRAAAAILCVGPWENILNLVSNSSTGHKFTKAPKAAHRCFELNYIISLLSVGYGFPADVRLFQFVDAIGGKDVEWSLGAYLFSRSDDSGSIDIAHDLSNPEGSGLNTIVIIAMVAPVVLVITLCGVLFAQRRCNKATCAKITASDFLGGETGKMA